MLHLFLSEQQRVGDGRVGVVDLVVHQLDDVFLADPVDEQRRREGEEGQEGAAGHPQRDVAAVFAHLHEQERLTGHSDQRRHEGERLDQLDLGGQDAFVDGLLVFLEAFFNLFRRWLLRKVSDLPMLDQRPECNMRWADQGTARLRI